jgi:hypothetical protein
VIGKEERKAKYWLKKELKNEEEKKIKDWIRKQLKSRKGLVYVLVVLGRYVNREDFFREFNEVACLVGKAEFVDEKIKSFWKSFWTK